MNKVNIINGNCDLQTELYYSLDVLFYQKIMHFCRNHIDTLYLKRVANYIPESGILELYNQQILHIVPILCSGLVKEGLSTLDDSIIQSIDEYISNKYPLLKKKEEMIIYNGVNTIVDILHKLDQDKNIISSTFNIDPDCRLTRIKLGCGDPHQGGKTVSQLLFSDGRSVFYKPRDLTPAVHFAEFISFISTGIDTCIKTPKIILRPNYAWEEGIQYKPCLNDQDVRDYYKRLGVLLVVLYSLEATDFHYENIIANGAFPVLIDLESLLCPYLPIDGTETNEGLYQSVLRTGILQSRLDFSEFGQQSVDVGGINSLKGIVSPIPQFQFQISQQGEISINKKQGYIQEGKNIPSLDGKLVSISDYSNDFVSGFEKGYRFLLENKDTILNMINSFSDDNIRIIIRPTVAYALLQHEFYKPIFLKDDRSLSLFCTETLMKSAIECPVLNRTVPYEVKSLSNGDVPYFTAKVSSNDLYLDNALCISHYFDKTGKETVIKRIQSLCLEDLNIQKWIIDTTIRMKSIVRVNRIIQNKEDSRPKENSEISLQKVIKDVYSFIRKNIHFTGDNTHWLILHPVDLEQEQYEIAEASYDLFFGMPGEILFLSYYWKVYNDSDARTLAEDAYKYLLGMLSKSYNSIKPIGLYAGWGSIIYLNSTLFRIYKEDKYIENNNKIITKINFRELIERDCNYSLIKGSAGFIVALCDYFQLSNDTNALQLSELAAQHLIHSSISLEGGIGWRIASRRPLSGLAHGSSGFALAFLRLYQATKKRCYLEMLERCLQYERSLFFKEKNNWRDVRDSVINRMGEDFCSVAWSHGAGGIGLFRLELIKAGLTSDEIIKEMKAAEKTVYEQGFTTNYDLSYGSFGNLELLFEIKNFYCNDEMRQHGFDSILDTLLSNYNDNNYSLGTSCKSLGLMTGYTGIGYECLRLLYPGIVKSILLV